MIWSQNHEYGCLATPIREQGYFRAKVIIDDDVWIGAGAIILPGVRIARGTVVAAGAVVTSSTSPFDVIGGVPAKLLKTRLHDSIAATDHQP